MSSLRSLCSLALLAFSVPSLPAFAQSTQIAPMPTGVPASPSSTSIPAVPSPRSPMQTVYYLGPGDVLDLKVYGYQEYTGSYMVLPDGAITLPLLGRVIALNKTADQLNQELSDRLQKLLKNPVVTLSVTKLRPVRVNVAGEVFRPGPVQLQSLAPVNAVGSTNQVLFPTVSEAISGAGGVTNKADIRRVMLRRYSPNGEVPPVELNLWDALASDKSPGDLVLLDGDTIYIPKVADGAPTLDRRTIARASFSPKTVRVRVAGEVRSPGEIEVRPDSTLSSALAIAGPTDKSQLKRVIFVRMNDDGSTERKELNLQNLADSTPVQEGDVLIVPKSTSRDAVDIAGQVASPLGILLRIFGIR